MQNNKSNAKKIAVLGILVALALGLSLLETAITAGINFAIPGVKLGIANIAVIFALVYLDYKSTLVISVIKGLATFLMSGSLTILWFSLAGSIVSAIVMIIFYKHLYGKLSLAGISIAGGVSHNVTQVIIMILVSSTPMFFYYIPVLTIAGVVSGTLTGIAANAIVVAISKSVKGFNLSVS